ncbi:deoxynucleotidyltransferase terminal-interacting protein 2 isoform X2 [Hyperolius riggenbachi]|uniref:deoxynucleotidyltransferase terminal-interacting protein 2 isoform X2 n=1 Tax=Hyperolius riggenbachi TaxID=752182 RepID=UPI0035A334B4
MVATRKGTRGERHEETAMEVDPPTSPRLTRRTATKESKPENSDRYSQNQSESAITVGSPSKNGSLKVQSQLVTRSRHRSGQSDADVSEAESTASNSSTRVTRSRQKLGALTDSARKLRSHHSAVVTEPILESKEEELSEAESVCSSVSSRARRTRSGISQSTKRKGQKSVLVSVQFSDHSDAESNCSSVSGLHITATRSTRASKATALRSLGGECQKEVSDAESFISGVSSPPLIKRSSSRLQSKLQSRETRSVSESSSQEQESPKKQRQSLREEKGTDPLSPVKEQKLLSAPCWSLRSRPVYHEVDLISSDGEVQGKEVSSKDSHVTEHKNKETSKEEIVNLLNESAEISPTLPKSPQSIHRAASDQMVIVIDDLTDEGECKDQDQGSADHHDDVETPVIAVSNIKHVNYGNQNVSSVPESGAACLIIDSEESEHNEGDNTREESEHIEAVNVDHKELKHSEADNDDREESEHSEADNDDHEESESSEADGTEESESSEDDVEIVEENSMQTKTLKSSAQKSQDMVGEGLFVIDTAPGMDSSKKYYVDHEGDESESENELSEKEPLSEPDEEEEFIDEDVDDEEELLNRPKKGFVLSTSIDTGMSIKEMGGLYISFDAEKPNPGPGLHQKVVKESKKDELLKKSVITPDFEKKEAVPPYTETLNMLKKQRKKEREKTTGQGWFDMKAPEMTEELKNDLKALKMRSAMDPKHFYKKNDREGFPKYFQVGTVVDSPVDYYHSRIPKKQRKRTIVEELLEDAEFRRYNKKKYKEILAEKAARAEGKKNRKKKKFRT